MKCHWSFPIERRKPRKTFSEKNFAIIYPMIQILMGEMPPVPMQELVQKSIEERITHFFGTSSFRYRKLRKTLVLIEVLQAIKFRWNLDGWKSTGNSVRMWVSKTKGNNKTKCSAFEAHVRNARCKASKRTAVLEVAVIFPSLWSNNSSRYFWRMRSKIKERFSLGGLFTL